MKFICQRSIKRARIPEEFANRSLLGPMGNSKEPLARKSFPTLWRLLP